MKDSTKYTISQQAARLLEAGRIKDCMTLLRRRLSEIPLPNGLGLLTRSETTYGFLLDYFSHGSIDPGRDSMLASIRCDLMRIADAVEKEHDATDSPHLYFSTLRMARLRPVDIPATLSSIMEKYSLAQLTLSTGEYPESLFRQIEEEEAKLFDAIWTNDYFSDIQRESLAGIFKNPNFPYTTVALCIAALGLNIGKYYNSSALQLIIDAALSPDPKIAARGTATLINALIQWSGRIADDKAIIDRLASMSETEGLAKRIRMAVTTLIRTRDTDRVSRKMKRDVIPGLMQFGPDIIKRLKQQTEESSFSDLEANPEWEELLSKSGLEEKLREITEMQSDGADVMMVAFSNLKGYPFFRHVRNWMLPFDLNHSGIRDAISSDTDSLATMLEMSGLMCDSDKFSFAFSLASMPMAQREMMISQIQGQMEQMKEQIEDLQIMKLGKEFDEELTRYFRDLYRFHKLFTKRGEFYDPFTGSLDVTEIPVVGDLFDSSEHLLPMGEFYFKRGYYSDALPLLRKVAILEADTLHIWEKIGFCLEKVGKNDMPAIEAYMKAQLFNPDSRWISRRLGICYRRAGDYRNAADCIRMAMPFDGSFDQKLSLLLADILMDAGKWEEALGELYRVDYESPDEPDVRRRMAKCAFRLNSLDKAKEWIESIPPIRMDEDDYRLLGHIALAQRNICDALARYRMTVRPTDTNRLWKSKILEDRKILESMGVSTTDLNLTLELMI